MIGGEHFFTPPKLADSSLYDFIMGNMGNVSFLSTGRDALFNLLKSLPHENILIPDLICRSVFDACTFAEKNITTYKIRAPNFDSDIEFLNLSKNTCVLIMHYFGIPSARLVKNAKNNGVTVISDVTHMLFNSDALNWASSNSDYLVASLRKSGPFPDGGFYCSKNNEVPDVLGPIREDFFVLRAAALTSRGFAARANFQSDENYKLIRRAEELIDGASLGGYACSNLSLELMKCIDIIEMAKVMRRNSSMLIDLLVGHVGIIANKNIISPYIPCLFGSNRERDFVRNKLAKEGIHCAIHWETTFLSYPSAISDVILSFPCDARYGDSDLLRLAELVKNV